MSLAGYFFGNVDEQGRLESDLDDELKETLSTVDAGVISKIFNDNTFGLENAKLSGDDEDDEDDEDVDILSKQNAIPTTHSSDAVDYSDFNEAVPDDPMFSEKYFRRGMGMFQKSLPKSRLSLVTDDYDDEDDEDDEDNDDDENEPLKVKQKPATLSGNNQAKESSQPIDSTKNKLDGQKVDIKDLYPGFEKGQVLKFSDLFMPRVQRPPKLLPNKRALYNDDYEYEVGRDDRTLFMRTSKLDRFRLEQAKQNVKRRKIESIEESSKSSENESEDDEYLEDLSDRVIN